MATKLDNKSFLVCCANGAGSSLMMKMTMQKVLDKLGVKPGHIHHCAIAEGKSSATQFDIVFCAKPFANSFAGVNPEKTIVLPLKNIMSVAEMEQALRDAGLVD